MSVVDWFPTDRQEIFNKMVLGLRAQGWKRSYRSQSGCVLRDDNGNKCAIGFLIPNEYYRSEMELITWGQSFGVEPSHPNVQFLNDCREAHDNHPRPFEMEKEFRDIAAHYNLVFPESNV